MKPLYCLFVSLIGCCLFINAQRKPLVGKEPSWVTLNTYNYKGSTLEQDAEDGYIDILYERQISVEQESMYFRKAIKILTETGVQNSSEISASFDPSYQQLVFHTIRILRDGKIINQLNISRMKIIQQEKELNRYIYNGALSTVLFLEDVRKGDIVEYSYTLKGANPVFKGRFANSFDMAYTVPIVHLYYKLIVPRSRKINFKNIGTTIQPTRQETGGQTVYEWNTQNLAPIHLQDDLPSWYDPFATILVSEYNDWQEVNDWAMGLFPAVTDVSPSLQKKITEIRLGNATIQQQALAALRFVQDDVRYLGIEMGQSSHRPGHPNKIFAQRFGDCKDKSYLLCTMLHELGTSAWPVLINTGYKKTIVNWLPSSKSFDHVTVRAIIGDKEYWFDPTISLQRGDLDHISYPDYQYGLVVGEGTNSLTHIIAKEPGIVKIKEVFDIKDMSGKARLTVLTDYSGSFADDMRSSFSNTSRYELLKTFREYYSSYYEDISADSLTYTDDEKTGILSTKEYYTVNELWELNDGVKKAFFHPYVINGVLRKPKETKRTMPFAVIYPARYKENIEINLPEEWKITGSTDRIETGAFTMNGSLRSTGQKIYINYDYEALQDHVTAEGSREFINGLKSKDDNFNYFLSYGGKVDEENVKGKPQKGYEKAKDSSLNLLIALLVLGGVGITVWWNTKRN